MELSFDLLIATKMVCDSKEGCTNDRRLMINNNRRKDKSWVSANELCDSVHSFCAIQCFHFVSDSQLWNG